MSDQINVNEIANTLQTKVDLPDGKNQIDVDFVIEWKAPTSGDSRWYRLYKSGWLEQGGNDIASGTGAITITMLKSFNDTTYTITSSILHNAAPVNLANGQAVGGKTVSSFQYYCAAASATGYNISWEAKGFAA